MSESFYDRPDGSSPRITSIAIRNLESGQTTSFSIHQQAELKAILPNDEAIEDSYNYNELEKEMLDRLSDYLRMKSDRTWLHWNMRDQSYGFQAIEHRHRVLGGDPVVVLDDRKVDLLRLLISLYGVAYIGHPRLENLLRKNNIEPKDFLSGAEEAEAFEQRRYVDLHRSTLRKVDVLCNLAQRAYDRILRTNSTWRQSRGMSMQSLLAMVQEHPIYSTIAIVVTIAAFFGLFL